MAQTEESRVKKDTKKLIEEVCKQRGLPYEIDWHAGSAFAQTLDGTGVIAGHPFITELKRFDQLNPLTGRQKLKVKAFRAAGAYVHVIDEPQCLVYLKFWLETLTPRLPHDP